MALSKKMEFFQIKRFLQEEVKEQVLFEIAPLLNLGTAQGGYFGTPRQILCMVDFLGAMYCGYDPKRQEYLPEPQKHSKKPRNENPSETLKAIKFINKVFGEIDTNYIINGVYLYEMYRHGLVHLYQPKELKLDNGKILSWMPYKGERENATVNADKTYDNVTHLKIYESDNFEDGKLRLPVSTKCLFYDLIQAIDIYTKLLEKDSELRKNWNSAAVEILKSKEGVGV